MDQHPTNEQQRAQGNSQNQQQPDSAETAPNQTNQRLPFTATTGNGRYSAATARVIDQANMRRAGVTTQLRAQVFLAVLRFLKYILLGACIAALTSSLVLLLSQHVHSAHTCGCLDSAMRSANVVLEGHNSQWFCGNADGQDVGSNNLTVVHDIIHVKVPGFFTLQSAQSNAAMKDIIRTFGIDVDFAEETTSGENDGPKNNTSLQAKHVAMQELWAEYFGDESISISRERGLLMLSEGAKRRLNITTATLLLPLGDECWGPQWAQWMWYMSVGPRTALMNQVYNRFSGQHVFVRDHNQNKVFSLPGFKQFSQFSTYDWLDEVLTRVGILILCGIATVTCEAGISMLMQAAIASSIRAMQTLHQTPQHRMVMARMWMMVDVVLSSTLPYFCGTLWILESLELTEGVYELTVIAILSRFVPLATHNLVPLKQVKWCNGLIHLNLLMYWTLSPFPLVIPSAILALCVQYLIFQFLAWLRFRRVTAGHVSSTAQATSFPVQMHAGFTSTANQSHNMANNNSNTQASSDSESGFGAGSSAENTRQSSSSSLIHASARGDSSTNTTSHTPRQGSGAGMDAEREGAGAATRVFAVSNTENITENDDTLRLRRSAAVH